MSSSCNKSKSGSETEYLLTPFPPKNDVMMQLNRTTIFFIGVLFILFVAAFIVFAVLFFFDQPGTPVFVAVGSLQGSSICIVGYLMPSIGNVYLYQGQPSYTPVPLFIKQTKDNPRMFYLDSNHHHLSVDNTEYSNWKRFLFESTTAFGWVHLLAFDDISGEFSIGLFVSLPLNANDLNLISNADPNNATYFMINNFMFLSLYPVGSCQPLF